MRPLRSQNSQDSMNGSTTVGSNMDNLSFSSPSENVEVNQVELNANAVKATQPTFEETKKRIFDTSKPLKFTDAVRLHESLSAHNVTL